MSNFEKAFLMIYTARTFLAPSSFNMSLETPIRYGCSPLPNYSEHHFEGVAVEK